MITHGANSGRKHKKKRTIGQTRRHRDVVKVEEWRKRQRHDLAAIATCLRLPARIALYHEAAPVSWLFVVT